MHLSQPLAVAFSSRTRSPAGWETVEWDKAAVRRCCHSQVFGIQVQLLARGAGVTNTDDNISRYVAMTQNIENTCFTGTQLGTQLRCGGSGSGSCEEQGPGS
jgi:hypothetical protein